MDVQRARNRRHASEKVERTLASSQIRLGDPIVAEDTTNSAALVEFRPHGGALAIAAGVVSISPAWTEFLSPLQCLQARIKSGIVVH